MKTKVESLYKVHSLKVANNVAHAVAHTEAKKFFSTYEEALKVATNHAVVLGAPMIIYKAIEVVTREEPPVTISTVDHDGVYDLDDPDS